MSIFATQDYRPSSLECVGLHQSVMFPSQIIHFPTPTPQIPNLFFVHTSMQMPPRTSNTKNIPCPRPTTKKHHTDSRLTKPYPTTKCPVKPYNRNQTTHTHANPPEKNSGHVRWLRRKSVNSCSSSNNRRPSTNCSSRSPRLPSHRTLPSHRNVPPHRRPLRPRCCRIRCSASSGRPAANQRKHRRRRLRRTATGPSPSPHRLAAAAAASPPIVDPSTRPSCRPNRRPKPQP